MKQLVTIVLILISFCSGAQEKKISPKEFIGIEISRGLRANLIPSTENKVVIKGKGAHKIQANVENGILNIKGSQVQLLENDDTTVDIYFSYVLSIEARQKSKVQISQKLKQPLLRLKAREGAMIFADLDVENVVATSVTNGNINLTGTAAIQEIEVKAGSYRGENLRGESINVVLNGNGNAHIFAKKYVNAVANAGGHIYVYGNPKEIHEKSSFGGSIKKIN